MGGLQLGLRAGGRVARRLDLAARRLQLVTAGLQARAGLVALAGQLRRASLDVLDVDGQGRGGLALGLHLGQPGERLVAFLRRRGGVALGVLDALAQDAGALDKILETRRLVAGLVLVGAGGEPARGLVAPAGLLGGGIAHGAALLGHAAIDVVAGERRRVDVADDDEDAGQAGVRVGLEAAQHHPFDGLQRAPVAQAQLLRMPGCVAAAQLGEQRSELPAQRERHADDDELQRARRGAGAAGGEDGTRRGIAARRAQHLLEGAGRLLAGAGGEQLGDRPADERLGGGAEQAGDADAALGDGPVGGAEHVAAVRESEQDLFEVAVDLGGGRGQLAAQKIHAPPIGRTVDWLSAGVVVGEMSRPRDAGDWRRARAAAILTDYRTHGDALWARFGQGRGPATRVYYRELVCAFEREAPRMGEHAAPSIDELRRTVEAITALAEEHQGPDTRVSFDWG